MNPIHTVDDAIKFYLTVQEKRDELKAKFDEKDGALESIQARITEYLTEKAKADGVEGYTTTDGDARRVMRSFARASDWSLFATWMRDNDEFDLVERRVHNTNLKKYQEGHNGELPPGVSTYSEVKMKITPPKK